ncbi:helix-turn-helix domain-containing protein [Pectinatus frisingensis]|uniref:helix-turn-helix domain-containing protein n=1 Tax=Pectinatus frisingensis TaxID=865 RepID=UPI0018C70B00|nr:helix-turn-helix transcriptional regulator [Pectinatus frisingensis]
MKYLSVLRKNKNFSVAEMAEQLGISESLYSKVECGQREPSRFFMKKLKEKFPEVDMNIFFDNHIHDTCINQKSA